MTRAKQGHPGRVKQDDRKQLERRVYQLMRESTHIVARLMSEDAPQDIIEHAQAGSLSLMSSYAWLTGLPAPWEARAEQQGWNKV